jgi:pimeloyl-ACP methyl ester carboxylesterase
LKIPEPQYLKTPDGAYIAFQVVGDGPVDIAWQLDFGGNLDVWWESAWIGGWFEGLAALGRVILHDWRGCGLSSRNVPAPNLETRTDDLRAVLDRVGSSSTVIGGWFESLAPGVLLAASDPGRVRAMAWWNPWPRTVWAPDYPWGAPLEDLEAGLEDDLKLWGTEQYGEAWADTFPPHGAERPSRGAIEWWAKKSRNSCTPDVAEALERIHWQTDICGVLPNVQAPTLLMVAEGQTESLAAAEHVASLMPDARIEVFTEPGWMGSDADIDAVNRPRLDAVARFIGLQPRLVVPDTVLSTVLFTDIVDSTQHQARLGDRDWKQLIEKHHQLTREQLRTWRGVENDTAGDGFYATFDGPARAIHCAKEVRRKMRGYLGVHRRSHRSPSRSLTDTRLPNRQGPRGWKRLRIHGCWRAPTQRYPPALPALHRRLGETSVAWGVRLPAIPITRQGVGSPGCAWHTKRERVFPG